MCGIVGIFGLEGVSAPELRLADMMRAMDHRGPDAEGQFMADNILLGHKRLSIIDINEASNQPFVSEDGRYVLVFNGEIYNYKEIRSQLNDFNFRTNSDTEVLLAAWMKWGQKSLQLFNGMFAFALWDKTEEKLVLVRDRLGIKPLYYAQVSQQLVFGSELRSLLASDLVPRKLNRQALREYLQYQTVHAPQTMVDQVKMLLPGTFMEVTDGETSIKEYWKPWQNEHFDSDPIKVQKKIREKLTSAVERRLVSDVPFGAFLSGGIDSSLIVGIMAERLGKNVDTFNVSFDESEFSEAKYGRQIAKKFKTNHHEIKLTPSDFLEALPDALNSIDHPSGDGPNSWIVSRETKRQGITMALSGLGGDELFAGYEVFRQIPMIAEKGWILSFPKALRKVGGKLLQLKSPGMHSMKQAELLLADYFDLENLYPVFRKVLMNDQIDALVGFAQSDASNAVKHQLQELERYNGFQQLPTLSRISIAEMYSYMQNVLLRDTDQMSMAHALEVRVPFLDHELVEYMMHVNDQIKYPTTPKKLLIESFADLLPDNVVNRPKMGFVLPWDHWMRNELKDFCEEKLISLSEIGILEESAVAELWQQFLSSDPKVSWSRIWPLVVLSTWIKTNRIEA